MKSIPVAVQFSLIVFLILVVPFIILMSYTGYTTLRYSQEEIARRSLENIELNRRFTENFMNNISGYIHRFAAYHDFYAYDGLQKYAAIQGNVENGMRIQRLQRELTSIARTDDAIHSLFMVFDNSDYVISSDRGIVEMVDYQNLSWLRMLSTRGQGLGGVWVPRELRAATLREILGGQDSGRQVRVISYVYTLSRLTTAVAGTVVINVRESVIANNLNPGGSRDSSSGTILLRRDGEIISHPREENFTVRAGNLPHIGEILDSPKAEGYEFFREGGGLVLYTWLKTGYFDWVYISVQSMGELLGRSTRMIRNMIFLSLAVVFFGTLASLGVFFLVSRPMRQLVKNLTESEAVKETAMRNEMDILSSAFTRIEHKEKELRNLLNEREKDAAMLAIRNLLSGDPLTPQETEMLAQIFPRRFVRVALAALDNYEDYRRRTSAEQRTYHRFLFISRAEELFASPLILRGLHLFEAQIALILNLPEGIETENLVPLLKTLGETAPGIFGTTVTVGLSESGFNLEGIPQCARQASQAVTLRMLEGSSNIIPWRYNEGIKRFYYPQNSEARILNYLALGNADLVMAELEGILKKIRETKGISYDNICFIYNQLAGVTIKHLSEMNIHTSTFFFGHGNVYKSIASCETLEQLNVYMGEFYRDILNYFRKGEGKEQPIDRILECFAKHFREDMFFEDMAAELEMSYSYMRKIVKEATGKSVNDTVNFLRIQEAKTLLLDAKLKPEQIARMVGYRNTQSLKRYFKKFEGLNPLEYRLANRMK